MATAAIEVGDKVPDFKLKDQDGKDFHFDAEIKQGPLLLVFYPGDFTAVCTKQLCNYRDRWSEFKSLGVRIVGLSGDKEEKHAKFSEEYKFPFPLLTDTDKKVAKQLGCTSKFLFGMVSRGFLLVGKDGTLLHRQVEPTPVSRPDAEKLLEVVREFKQKGSL